MATQNGKGDRNRSDPEKYAKGYDRIFGRKQKKTSKVATKKKPRMVQ